MDTSSMTNIFDAIGATGSLVCFAIYVVMIIAWWKLFTKADIAGWLSLIPIVNIFMIFKIAFGSAWKALLMLIPIVNIVVEIMLPFKLAKAYGKGFGFGLGLLFLAPIFLIILGFSDASYVGYRD